jgi:hypothetical protein
MNLLSQSRVIVRHVLIGRFLFGSLLHLLASLGSSIKRPVIIQDHSGSSIRSSAFRLLAPGRNCTPDRLMRSIWPGASLALIIHPTNHLVHHCFPLNAFALIGDQLMPLA